MPSRYYDLPDVKDGGLAAHPTLGERGVYRVYAHPGVNDRIELGRAVKRRYGFAAYRADGTYVDEQFKTLQAACEGLWGEHRKTTVTDG